MPLPLAGEDLDGWLAPGTLSATEALSLREGRWIMPTKRPANGRLNRRTRLLAMCAMTAPGCWMLKQDPAPERLRRKRCSRHP